METHQKAASQVEKESLGIRGKQYIRKGPHISQALFGSTLLEPYLLVLLPQGEATIETRNRLGQFRRER